MPPAGTVIQASSANSQGTLIPAGSTNPQTVYLTLPGITDSVVFNLSTLIASGGNTVTVTVNGYSQSGYAWLLLASSAIATVTNGTYLAIGPGLPVTASAPIFAANNAVPYTMQIVVAVAGIVSYGIDYEVC